MSLPAQGVEQLPLVLGLFVTFVAGVISFASPCCLPLLPGYLGHLAGATVTSPATPATRGTLLSLGFAFVLGFTVVFTVAGIAIAQLLVEIQSALGYVRWFGGIVVILTGLHLTGLVPLPRFDPPRCMSPAYSSRASRWTLASPTTPASIRAPLVRSFALGLCFAAGWSPCIGPVLTGVYGVAAMQPAHGGALFFAYSMGLGVPFLLSTLLIGRAQAGLRRLNRSYCTVSIASGVLLIAVGTLLFTDAFVQLTRFGPMFPLPGGG